MMHKMSMFELKMEPTVLSIDDIGFYREEKRHNGNYAVNIYIRDQNYNREASKIALLVIANNLVKIPADGIVKVRSRAYNSNYQSGFREDPAYPPVGTMFQLVLKKEFDPVEVIKHLIIVEQQANRALTQFQFSSAFLPRLYSALAYIQKWEPSIEYETYEGIKIAGHPNSDEIFLKDKYTWDEHNYIPRVAEIMASVKAPVEKPSESLREGVRPEI